MKILKFTILMLFTTQLTYSQTDTCGINWGEIIQISHDSASSYIPQIVASGDTIHIIWFNSYVKPFQDSLLGIYYSHSFDGGKTFTSQRQLISYLSAGGNTGILAVQDRFLYILYIAVVDTPPKPYSEVMGLIRSTDAGITWLPRQLLGDYDPWGITTHDSSVYIYFGYSDETRRTYSGCMVSKDYGKNFNIVSLGLPRGGGAGYYAVNKLIISNNCLHYIYEFSLPIGNIGYSEVAYKRSTDFGLTWSVPDTLSVIDSINSQHPRIAGDDKGNIYVIWNDQKYGGDFSGTIVMRHSTDNGLTWLPEQVISQFATALQADVSVVDSIIFVVWSNEPTLNLDSISGKYSRDYGKVWSEIYFIGNDTSRAGGPTVFLSKRNIHIVWWQRPPEDILYITGNFSSACYPEHVPSNFVLRQNYPNPFNNKTIIEYDLPKHQNNISLIIYNLLGQEVKRLITKKEQNAGHYSIEWNAVNVPSGVYFYRLTSESFTSTKKLVLLR